MRPGWVPTAALVLALLAAASLWRRDRDDGARRTVALLRGRRRLLAAVGLVAVLLPVAAYRYVDATDYALDLGASAVAFASLYLLLLRFRRVADGICRGLVRMPVMLLAALFVAAAVAAGWLVLDGVPHISDAVAYQLQAKAMAGGSLSIAAPDHPEFFGFTHTLLDGTRWYGIMNPGWPAILAIGYLVGAPWLVNPVLGGLTLLALHAFLRRAGFGETDGRVAVVLLAISPFALFLSASYMSHAASLLAFVLLLLFWARVLDGAGAAASIGAGLALVAGMLIRPVDAAAVAAPLGLHLAYRAIRDRKYAVPLVVVGLFAVAGIALTLVYNQRLTGDPLLFPVTKYFQLRNPAERFGLGFGADMGTSIHGSEWPGFYPLDAVKVTAHRFIQFLRDVHGVPLVMLAALALGLARLPRERSRWKRLVAASALALVGVYVFHFYHGIAYGSRHYYLALPAAVLALSGPISRLMDGRPDAERAMGRSALAALVLTSALIAYPPLLREYGHRYRGASGWVRDAVRERGIHDALVFVEPGNWSWKSAFPLNSLPIGTGDVIFARDLGERNAVLMAAFPERSAYRVGESEEGVVVERLRP
ncbi:MAG: hypothetical protein ACE5HF_00955 [Gemmatimonadota bacterium]